MNNSKIETSLDNTNELKRIIIENPELPLLVFCGEESYGGDWCYNMALVSKVKVEEVTWHEELYISKGEYRGQLRQKYVDICDSGEQFSCLIKQKMKDVEFIKAIVIYVG